MSGQRSNVRGRPSPQQEAERRAFCALRDAHQETVRLLREAEVQHARTVTTQEAAANSVTAATDMLFTAEALSQHALAQPPVIPLISIVHIMRRAVRAHRNATETLNSAAALCESAAANVAEQREREVAARIGMPQGNHE